MLVRNCLLVAFGFVCTFVLLLADSASAAFLNRGDVVVVDNNLVVPQLVRVDPLTGDRTVLSGFTRGEGAALVQPVMVSQTRDGGLLVGDFGGTRIVRIDPETGNRTIVSQTQYDSTSTDLIGDGPSLAPLRADPPEPPLLPGFPHGIDQAQMMPTLVEPDGRILVLAPNGLFRVDPATGDRTLLSSASVGSGPTLDTTALGLVRLPNGEVYVANRPDGILHIDLATGNRTIISDADTGTGPLFRYLGGMVVDPNGSLLVGSQNDIGFDGIFRIDPLTGNRELLPNSEQFIGWAMDWLAPGKLVLTALDGKRTVQVYDIATGQYSTLSGDGIGSGPNFSFPIGVLVYVPEPSSLAMAACGAVGLALAARRRVMKSRRG